MIPLKGKKQIVDEARSVGVGMRVISSVLELSERNFAF